MHTHALVAAIAALSFCPSLFAADAAKADAKPAAKPAPAAAAAPAVPPELAQLAFFEGDWTCSGTTFASPMGPEHATQGTVHAAKAVGGRWLHIAYDEKKTAANPNPYHAGVYMGYDADKKDFVQGCVDVFGGYCSSRSSGWNGDTLVFEGTAQGMGGATGARDTFVKNGAGELTHRGDMQGPDKQWLQTDAETCKKAK